MALSTGWLSALDMVSPVNARWLVAGRVGVAWVLSVPVYAVYEAFVRAINPAPRPLDPGLIEALGAEVCDMDLSRVRVVAPARIPSGHGGLTLGWTVFVRRAIDPTNAHHLALIAHELMHVRQAQRWGRWGMARRYGVEWIRQLSYRDHPLEVEARAFEAAVVRRRCQPHLVEPSST